MLPLLSKDRATEGPGPSDVAEFLSALPEPVGLLSPLAFVGRSLTRHLTAVTCQPRTPDTSAGVPTESESSK